MGKFDLAKITTDAYSAMRKHSPEILTGIGIAGMLSAFVAVVKATPKALELLKEKGEDKWEKEGSDKLTPLEVVQTTWKCYVPAVIISVTSIACLVGGLSANMRRNAAISTAYSLSETALKEYKAKVVETIGEKKETAVRDSIAQDKVNRDPVNNKEIIVVEKGNTLCYDCKFGRYFTGDIERIKKAVHTINHRVVSYGYVSLNDFWYEIGLTDIPIGEDLGWNSDDGVIEVDFSSVLSSEDKPCLAFDYNLTPHDKYC